ncbi:MAG: T9SS type B sorting domain-containing protein [Sphingobacteriales bacterium]|nr:MAG: T9SS type B sorting domain-containing protein [Sphingobacteriales bacterium]
MRRILLLVLLYPIALTAQVNLDQGLVSYYPFSGNPDEVTGNGVNGVAQNGAQLTTDRFGQINSAYYFDGVDDYIQIPSNATLNPTTAFSIALYFNPEQNSVQTLIGKISYFGGVGTQYQIAINFPPQPGVLFGTNPIANSCAGVPLNGQYVNTGSNTITNGQWHCVVASFENGIMKIYLNGVLMQTATASFNIMNICSNADVQIGSWWNGDQQRFKGKIDDVRFYDRALNAQEVAALCSQTNPVPCNNWLSIPSAPGYVNVGDLDVIGNKLTVEAAFNRTTPFTGGDLYAGNLVSKHDNPSTVNYLLRPNSAEITTSNGYFIAQAPCGIELNKTYHVAMTYDGTTLKFYRNGFLLSQVPATGNLYQNNLQTRIGWLDFTPLNENFIGHINEVRIWNVTKSQSEIRTYMNTSLPNASTLPGLLGYYTFNDLVNKQGNISFNGTLAGSAVINQTNPICTFNSDSCAVTNTISSIINEYTPVVSMEVCKNIINVEDAARYNVGDTIMIIQMKGAEVNSTNTAAFGSIVNYNSAGNYEFNYIKAKVGNAIELRNTLLKSYTVSNGKVQLVRVPYYTSIKNEATLTCLPWDGNKGGVLVFNVRDTFTMQANINVNGRGFRGGNSPNNNQAANACNQNDFTYPVGSINAAAKGEGIVSAAVNSTWGKGAQANAGGGGNGHNAGGGGGSNFGQGGFGGYQLISCGSAPFDNRGVGGYGLQYNNTDNKIFMGGGGGSGHANNSGGSSMPGGNGGGIVIINSNFIQSNGYKIFANGTDAKQCTLSSFADCYDAGAGGGAGGTVLLTNNNYLSPVEVQANAGKGGDVIIFDPGSNRDKIGPGGGGGGGVIWLNTAALPAVVTPKVLGGNNGKISLDANNAWGATTGTTGTTLLNLALPISTTPFRPNIDSVRFTPNATACRIFAFNGFGYTNTHPVASWQWTFGDGGTANTQNTSHTYSSTGLFNVKLVVTDVNGCKDSITRQVNTNSINVFAGNDASYCSNTAVTHTLSGSGGGTSFNWQPAALLNDNTIANPIATISATTKFYLSQSDPLGCTAVDSVVITVNPVPLVTAFSDTAFCANRTLTLQAGGASTYVWSPAAAVSNATIANPIYVGTSGQTMTVTGTNAAGCSASRSFNVTVKPLPTIVTIPDTTICNTQAITLTTTGAQTYSWSPAINLSNPSIANPVFSGSTGNTYTVTGTAANGCSNTDVVVITARVPGVFNTPPNTSVCIGSAVSLNGNNGNAVTYLWSPAGSLNNPTIMSPVATPTRTGQNTYAVLISETVCNSSRSFNVNVLVHALPNVDANRSNDLDCAIRTSQLTATGAGQYSWTPAATLSNAAIANPVASPNSDTKYIVTGTDINGCKNKDSVMVLVKATDGRYDVPNSFTPNNDGKNDCFGVRHWGAATGFQLMIFNRWGEKVFETNNLSQCWDGRYKGQPADGGGYVYYIKSVNLCGETFKKGNVLLIR